jgi:hypothetical protein
MSIHFPCGGDPAAAAGYLRVLAADLEAMTMFAPHRELDGAPRIENWSVITRPMLALQGMVTGHPLLGDRNVVTSELYAIDRGAGWARTLSRFYVLGTPADFQEMN